MRCGGGGDCGAELGDDEADGFDDEFGLVELDPVAAARGDEVMPRKEYLQSNFRGLIETRIERRLRHSGG